MAPRALALGLVLAVCAAGCESGGVGDPCVPEDEYQVNFGGFGLNEVNIEARSLQCASRLCLINHFQGRVSCPYGQTQADLGLPATHPARCRLPNTKQAVAVPVSPWNAARTPERAVYCSCRCAGPDPNARYCQCPSGYACTPLVADLGLGNSELAGSYCVKSGTVFSVADETAPDCTPSTCDAGPHNP